MTNLFLTLTDSHNHRQYRIKADSIIAYSKVEAISTGAITTRVFLNHGSISSVDINQTPEDIDTLLREASCTVRREGH